MRQSVQRTPTFCWNTGDMTKKWEIPGINTAPVTIPKHYPLPTVPKAGVGQWFCGKCCARSWEYHSEWAHRWMKCWSCCRQNLFRAPGKASAVLGGAIRKCKSKRCGNCQVLGKPESLLWIVSLARGGHFLSSFSSTDDNMDDFDRFSPPLWRRNVHSTNISNC